MPTCALLACGLVRNMPSESAVAAVLRSARFGAGAERVRSGDRRTRRDRRTRGAARAGALRTNGSRRRRFSYSRSRSLPTASARKPQLHVPEFAALTQDEFRRLCEFLYRRTGMVFTEAKRYYVERRVVERMIATGADSFEDYFARLRGDAAGRGRAIRQRLHGQRDVLLSRRAPACVPHVGPACREVAGEAARRADPDLVRAVLDRRGALFDRDLAARKLAARRSIRHRDRRIGHRHRAWSRRRARASTVSAR